ncbi:MAG: hypothetical protein ACPLKX_02635 [Dictyoglomaceae bacterium]
MFRWLKKLFTPTPLPPLTFNIKVRCKKCGEIILVRIRAREESNPEFGPQDQIIKYELWKDVLGEKCPNLMRLHIEFSPQWEITFQEVEGGEIIKEE